MQGNKPKYVFTFIGLLAILAVSRLFTFSLTDKQEDKLYDVAFKQDYKIYSVHMPDKLDFAGEPVPLSDFDIVQRADREFLVNTYWQSSTLLLHKRAHQWFPVIEPILKANGIPDDFKYLALIESGLTQVVSPAGATGFWQLMEATAEGYGLEVNKEVDERYHIEKATEAACKYIKEAYDLYGNWTLAAASYNMGMNGLSRQLERQRVSNYYDLLLNSETERYIFRILAIKEIISNPQDYGFYIRKKDLYPALKTYTVQVDTTVSDLVTFAESYGINYKMLKIMNPWLRQTYLPNKSRKKYQIKLPEKGYTEHERLLEAAGIHEADSVYQIDYQELDATTEQKNYHTVKVGETIGSVAKKYSISSEDLKATNHFKDSDTTIVEGQKLIIPNAAEEP